MFCESGGDGNVGGLDSIWRVTDNGVGQVCEESRSGQPGTSYLALRIFWSLILLPGTFFDCDGKVSSPVWDVCFGCTCFVKSAVDSPCSFSTELLT